MAWPQYAGALVSTKRVRAAPKAVVPQQSVYNRSAWKHTLTIRVERPLPNVIRAIATSNKSIPENIYYFWYVDGTYMGMTRRPVFEFNILSGEHIRIDVLDSCSRGFDAEGNAPDVVSARYTLYWNPSDEETAYYRVRQQKSGGSWVTIGKIRHEQGRWNYCCVTPVLDDQGTYTFDVAAVDARGNVGSTVAADSVKIWRIPDPRGYTAAYDEDTDKVTFSEAT